jgi:predicted nicotinamide N-methyase
LLLQTNDSRKSRTFGGEDLTGLSGWGLTRAFAAVLLASGGKAVRGKDVVELGCGTGLLGICTKLAGAKSAVLTDRSVMVLELARENARLNELGAGQEVSFAQVEWSSRESGAGSVGDVACADVVVASECVHYALDMGHKVRGEGVAKEEEEAGRWDALVATAARMMRPQACFLLCVRLRGRRDTAFEYAARQLQVPGYTQCIVCLSMFSKLKFRSAGCWGAIWLGAH